MIEKIALGLISESGETVEVLKTSNTKVEMNLEMVTADLFSAICFVNNSIKDEEIKIVEKFHFAVNLKNYLKEINQNAD